MFEIFGCICKAILTENFLLKLTITLLPSRLRQMKKLPTMWETKAQSLVGKIPGEGNGNPLQYSCLEHPMDRGASGWGWGLESMGSKKSRIQLSG